MQILLVVALGLAAEAKFSRVARVYEINDPEKRTLYTYKTWDEAPGLRKATYVEPDGVIALTEEYRSENGAFVSYELNEVLRGRTVRVRSDGTKLRYELTEKSPQGTEQPPKVKADGEDLDPLHAVGPGLLMRLLSQWDRAMQGETVSMRVAVPDRFESWSFSFEKVSETDTTVDFHLRPDSFIVRPFVKPIEFTFDKQARLLRQYRGPTQIHRRKGRDWEQLVAVMDYRMEPETVTPSSKLAPRSAPAASGKRVP